MSHHLILVLEFGVVAAPEGAAFDHHVNNVQLSVPPVAWPWPLTLTETPQLPAFAIAGVATASAMAKIIFFMSVSSLKQRLGAVGVAGADAAAATAIINDGHCRAAHRCENKNSCDQELFHGLPHMISFVVVITDGRQPQHRP
ncbi:hypothetical protein [Sulfitobacter mediterraneus]|uniref:hypothetical protein n=1 Tax=Sulfitobacter mediterraneus TaxID=83219 RepID=UPI0021A8CBF2|nr:hypothetical protein [Sulfitobacter mediterraneus]UWR10902.1 hypothetical protein K3753_16880 [Sulfitobacter mediterraneus]